MNGIIKLIVLFMISFNFVVGFNIRPAAAITHSFPTTIAASFEQDQGGRWRAFVNVTVTNDYTSNVTLNWIQMTTVNVTYIDDSFENLGISGGGNLTLGNRLAPGDLIVGSWGVPGLQGFSKEPKNLGVVVELSVQGFENRVTPFLIVPEFPSFLPVLLIMVVTLMTMILRKKSAGHARA